MYFEDAKLKCAEGTASATEILDRLRCSGPGEKLSFVYWSQRISGGNEQHRNPKSSVYAHPIRYAWTMHNPITAVRTSSQRLRDPEFLSPKELQALLRELEPRKRTMVLLDASTGLRRSELMALHWGDIDFEALTISVTKSIFRNVVGKPKTPGSKRPVALHPIVAAELNLSKAESAYRSDSDYLFPSVRKNGSQPLTPYVILKRHIRPVLAVLRVKKRIGWALLPSRPGNDAAAGESRCEGRTGVLRHANPSVTKGLYQQAVTDERRDAQDRALKGFLGIGLPSST